MLDLLNTPHHTTHITQWTVRVRPYAPCALRSKSYNVGLGARPWPLVLWDGPPTTEERTVTVRRGEERRGDPPDPRPRLLEHERHGLDTAVSHTATARRARARRALMACRVDQRLRLHIAVHCPCPLKCSSRIANSHAMPLCLALKQLYTIYTYVLQCTCTNKTVFPKHQNQNKVISRCTKNTGSTKHQGRLN